MYKACARDYEPSDGRSKFPDTYASANPLHRHNSISMTNMDKQIEGLRIAIVVTDGFEQDELVKPRQALDEASAKTEIVSPQPKKVKGWKNTDWGQEFAVDRG
jgi:hypothetical protein